MRLELQEYRPRRIVNVHQHVDGPWFWGKYSAHPYVGCRSGCDFCYARGGRYLGRRDPDTFDQIIQVKVNAVELLRRELPRLPREVIAAGDWQQPAEGRYRLSRGMLEVIHDLGFPLYVNERSPLVTRDLDLLTAINERSYVSVSFSLSGVDPALKRAFEPRSPGVKQRLQAMERLAEAGILVGASLMPILPLVGDDERHLDDAICAVRDHGGSYVIAGGMTMDGAQAERTLEAARRLDPSHERRWRELYGGGHVGSQGHDPPLGYHARLGRAVREVCARHLVLDRMPRYVAPGPLAVNQRVAERLFLRTYDLELEEAPGYRIWAYRKAAWAVDEHPTSVAEILATRGEAGLRELPGVGSSIAREVAGWIRDGVVGDGGEDGAGPGAPAPPEP
jgi:DNA repair photolyase